MLHTVQWVLGALRMLAVGCGFSCVTHVSCNAGCQVHKFPRQTHSLPKVSLPRKLAKSRPKASSNEVLISTIFMNTPGVVQLYLVPELVQL
jgi:hypothetical protein